MRSSNEQTKFTSEKNYTQCMTCALLYFLNKSYIITLNNEKLDYNLDNNNFLTIESIDNEYITYNVPSMVSKECTQTYIHEVQNGVNETQAQMNYMNNRMKYTLSLLGNILESSGCKVTMEESDQVMEITSLTINSREWSENELLCKGYDVYMGLYNDFKYISRRIYEMNTIM